MATVRERMRNKFLDTWFGWPAGAGGGAGMSSGVQDAVTPPLDVSTGLHEVDVAVYAGVIGFSGGVGVVSGLIGGGLGYGLSNWWSPPSDHWNFRTAFGFSFVMSLLVASILGFSSLQYVAANPQLHTPAVIGTGLIAGLVATGLGATLDFVLSAS